ncbi:hypothetical protein HOP50_07g49530 [Chloropicon primus]|uniref:Uncharacterized protein n=1 Tax=Chloropicon primus TaxID=1764295 RepID=A0A5B8MPJ9_9CHLO|nr:hypothetical protein A3770_07p49310 [Chloropicon primus]UPR01631.1 hypothetical protein HOP50_07g49530 [Chloropicon primus]|eukprot:QDZ22413.1 hypothetical protein A3770_07p49310 [Chloropicon primus]
MEERRSGRKRRRASTSGGGAGDNPYARQFNASVGKAKRSPKLHRTSPGLFGVSEGTVLELKKVQELKEPVVVLPPSIGFLKRVSSLTEDREAMEQFIEEARVDTVVPSLSPSERVRVFGRRAFEDDEEGAKPKGKRQRPPTSANDLQDVPVLCVPSVAVIGPRPRPTSAAAATPRVGPTRVGPTSPAATSTDKGFVLTDEQRRRYRQLRHSNCMMEVVKLANELDQALEELDLTRATLVLAYLDTLGNNLTHEMIQIAELGTKLCKALRIVSAGGSESLPDEERIRHQVLRSAAEKITRTCVTVLENSARLMIRGTTYSHNVLDILLTDAAMSLEHGNRDGPTTDALPPEEQMARDLRHERKGGESNPTGKWKRFMKRVPSSTHNNNNL